VEEGAGEDELVATDVLVVTELEEDGALLVGTALEEDVALLEGLAVVDCVGTAQTTPLTSLFETAALLLFLR